MFIHLHCSDKVGGELEGITSEQCVPSPLLVWHFHLHAEILFELYPSSLSVAVDQALDFRCL